MTEESRLDEEVKLDLKEWIESRLKGLRLEAVDCLRDHIELDIRLDEFEGVCLTVSTNETGSRWSFQTGDNSFTGGCYGDPHWAVTWIYPETEDADEVYDDIINQLEERLAEAEEDMKYNSNNPPMNMAQFDALKKLFERSPDGAKTFEEFQERVTYDNLNGCHFITWCNMVVGIEKDGYTHT